MAMLRPPRTTSKRACCVPFRTIEPCRLRMCVRRMFVVGVTEWLDVAVGVDVRERPLVGPGAKGQPLSPGHCRLCLESPVQLEWSKNVAVVVVFVVVVVLFHWEGGGCECWSRRRRLLLLVPHIQEGLLESLSVSAAFASHALVIVLIPVWVECIL
jgi:hypothetical protein